MVQAAIRKDNNKGKQNIQYNEDFTNFLIILGSFSTRAFDQNIRYFIYFMNLINYLLILSVKFFKKISLL